MLRGLAALMVVIFHSLESNPWYKFQGGGAGVDVFFAISGFVMAISTQQLRIEPGAPFLFLKRRLIRIMPLYWAVTLLALGLYYIHGGSASKSMRGAYVIASFLLVPVWRTLPPSNAGWHPVLNPGWTLSFEMLFYLLFALTIRSSRQIGLLTIMLGSLVIAGFFVQPESGPAILNLLNPRLLEFLGGVAIGTLVLRGYRLSTMLSWLVVGTFVALVLAFPVSASTWYFAALGLISTLLVLAMASLEEFWRTAPRWGIYLGDSSYSIYLSHTLVLIIVFLAFRAVGCNSDISTLAASLIGILLAIAIGCLLSTYVELPVHRSLMRSLRGRSPDVSRQG